LFFSIVLIFVGSRSLAPQAPTTNKSPQVGPTAPQSTHFPILLLAFGNQPPSWELRIGQKGPERLDRAGYPPVPLEAGGVVREGTTDTWTYNAKDLQTDAAVVIHLTREPCSADASATKYAFHAIVEHTQIGTLTGCARIAAELFPKISNQSEDEKDETKKPPAPETVIKFKAPVAVAYLNAAGRVVLGRGATRKIVAASGRELSLSHDGKKLLYTRSDARTAPQATIVLYDSETGRSQDLISGAVREAFWSPDDSRVAFLKSQDGKWQVWTFAAGAAEKAAPLYVNNVNGLQGWADNHTVVATDGSNAYWVADDGRPVQGLALKDLYGAEFRVSDSDQLRISPVNPDLVVVSAFYTAAPKGAPVDADGFAGGLFLYELHAKRRVILTPPDEWARSGEWSKDGVQIFHTRRLSATSAATYRIFWDGSGLRRYTLGTDFVVGE